MPRFYRGMLPEADGQRPKLGHGTGGSCLGVRPGAPPQGDIPVINGFVNPGTGGLSGSDDPTLLPPWRAPKRFGGRDDSYQVFFLEIEQPPAGLLARYDDPTEPNHLGLEPSARCLFTELQAHIHATQGQWTIA